MATAFGIEGSFGPQIIDFGKQPEDLRVRMRGILTWASGLVVKGEIAKAPIMEDGTTTSLLVSTDPTLFTSESRPMLVVPSGDLIDGTVVFTDQPLAEIEADIAQAAELARQNSVHPAQEALPLSI